MTKEDIIRMARESGIGWGEGIGGMPEFLERFAALVAVAKDTEHAEKLKYDIHSCGPTCTRYACVAVREAVEAEREACAEVCENFLDVNVNGKRIIQNNHAKLIRARKDNT